MDGNVLYLPVSAEWFKLIKDGVKRVEYREIKAHWVKRLFLEIYIEKVKWEPLTKDEAEFLADPANREYLKKLLSQRVLASRYDYVEFTEGYPKKDDEKRRARYKIAGITIDYPQKGLCPDEFLSNEYICIEFAGYKYLTDRETAGIVNCLCCKHCLPPAQRKKGMCELNECKFEEA